MLFSLSLLQVVILLPISALLIAWLYIQWAYHRQLSLARKLPTAIPAYPLLGHILDMRTVFRVGSLTWKLVLGHASGLCTVWLGPVPVIMAIKPEHMKVILNNSNALGKDRFYNTLKFLLGNGLLTAPAEQWKINRKNLNTMFHSENLLNYLPVINESARHLVEDLAEHDGKGMFDCTDNSFSFTLLNILKLIFGPNVEIDEKSEEFKYTVEGVKEISKLLGERVFNPIMKYDTIFKLLRQHVNNYLAANKKFATVLMEKRKELKITMQSKGETAQVKTFLDIFNSFKDKDPSYNEEYMMYEMYTLIGTGTDTNALTVASSLVALGSHPEIQRKLYEEIISVVGEDSEVFAEDIGKMTYLDQVLKETLRCFSTVPLSARKCEQDIQLDGHLIPEGTTVVLSYVGLNNNEEVFPDHLRFDPDRFSPENVSKRHSYSYLPFSGGPRNCIGKNFAMFTMKIVLVHLLKSYEIRSEVDMKNINYKFSLTMMPLDDYKISIRKRV